LVVGVGINVHNPAPTTSVYQLLSRLNTRSNTKLPDFKQEKLLARILVTFEEMYYRFCSSGWQAFEEMYYKYWLHTDQIVTLETEGGVKARVKGVTRDYGLLRVEELGTGKEYTLQSDGNSFDFFKGLLKRKT
jgi:biotin--protein ligase